MIEIQAAFGIMQQSIMKNGIALNEKQYAY